MRSPQKKDIFTTSSKFAEVYDRLKTQRRILKLQRVASPTKQEFLELAKEGYPFIIASMWSRKFSPEFLAKILVKKHGNAVVGVRHGNYAKPEEYVKKRKSILCRLRDIAAPIIASSEFSDFAYAGNVKVPGLCQSLGLKYPQFYKPKDFIPPSLWLGPKGAITPLHKDGTDNFACHLWGKKRWTLFPVRDITSLYMHEIHEGFSVSDIDLRMPDNRRFPKFKNTAAIEVELNAGETLYLPSGWGHFVENLENTIMINFWIDQKQKEDGIFYSDSIREAA